MQRLASTAALNESLPFLDWYVLPESYSAPLVASFIDQFGVQRGETVLDPFCGAGTTVVYASSVGRNAVGIEVNPFLAFAAEVKSRWQYDICSLTKDSDRVISSAEALMSRLEVQPRLLKLSEEPLDDPGVCDSELLQAPAMPRLHRWISPRVVEKVLILRALVRDIANDLNRELLSLALAAIIRPVSNMKLTPHAFGSRQEHADAPVLELFAAKVRKMQKDIESVGVHEQRGAVHVVNKDARAMSGSDSELLPATLAITSPPYLNNLDYTMQTRLELFFLGFVDSMKGLTALRKRMVTSDAKAMYREISDHQLVADVPDIAAVVRMLDDKLGHRGWGWDYAFMTAQYFGGLLRVLQSAGEAIRKGGHFVLVVGDSAHSGILVPVCKITALLGEMSGYRAEETTVLRERRSSSHGFALRECAVVLEKV